MHLLILGYSSIVERRVLAAAGRTDLIDTVSIASRNREQPKSGWLKQGRFYRDYSSAISNSGADVAYVSLANSQHEEWALVALQAGMHVIVDKPAFLTTQASERGVTEARRRNLLLAEATVFNRHPHFDALTKFVDEHGPLTHIDAQFIIPPLPKDNFRNHSELGGGCLSDMGPYAAALARLFGGGKPNSLSVVRTGRLINDTVDTGFSLLMTLANGAVMTGHFSFEGEYQNRLIVVARTGSIVVERCFSPPADQPMVWRRRIRNVEDSATFAPADAFSNFIAEALQAAMDGKVESYYRDLSADATYRSNLARRAAIQ